MSAPHEPHPKARAYALDKLRTRHARLGRLLRLGAPDAILAREAHLVGAAGRMLEPHALAAMDAEAAEAGVRRLVGACVDPGCMADAVASPTYDSLCQPHLDELDAQDLDLAAQDLDLAAQADDLAAQADDLERELAAQGDPDAQS